MQKRLLYLLSCLFLLGACDEDITLDLPAGEEDIVVYGFIEQDSLPFVMLTRSIPVFSTVKLENIQNGFVHNATVTINNGDTTIPLIEYNVPSDGFYLYFYSVPFSAYNIFKGEAGKTYALDIQAEGKHLTATTTIPQPVPLDSVWWKPHPDPGNDSLIVLWGKYSDPPEAGNYARYFTKRNEEPFYPGYFASVFDDAFLEGQDINFAIPRGQDRDDEIDETYSYFWRGDTLTVRWSMMDRPHYDFWMTLEIDRNSSGNPFGSPTKVLSNINGGLGIWGGYGSSYHTLIIP